MPFAQFLSKQLIDVIQWNEPADGVLAFRFPMQDMEIQSGAQLTVRESEMAVFVNEGRVADVFGPGLHTLTTHNLPILTDLLNWDKGFLSPFKSDIYFFSTHLQLDQKWGTSTPITIRDQEFGAVSLRCYGIYSYRIADPRLFFTQISGTHEAYFVSDLEGELRDTILAGMGQVFATSEVSFLDMAANQVLLGGKILGSMQPAFAAMGLELTQFAVESVSLPDSLQHTLDQRIGMKMVGDLDQYTRFAAAQAMTLAAANPGGSAGLGMGVGIGAAISQAAMGSLQPAVASKRFCVDCGHAIPQRAQFCPDCGKQQ